MSAKVKSRGGVRGKACKVLLHPGQVGVVVGAEEVELEGHILLRTYNSFVSLSDPAHTWSNVGNMSLVVEVLPAGTKIIYTSEA